MRIIRTAAVLALLTHPTGGQEVSAQQLAHLLLNADTRSQAIIELISRKEQKLAVVMEWTKTPPSDLTFYDVQQLDIGMAEVFGYLKTREAIPFLVDNISLNSAPITNVWARTPEVIEQRLPAVAALIRIGPDASRAVMKAADGGKMSVYDRLAAIFVVSRISGVPEAREFLNSELGAANMLRYRAEEALQFIGPHQ